MFSSQKCVKIAKPYKNQINFFAYAESYVKILVLVRILDEFQNSNLDLGPARRTDHGTLCVSSGPPLLTPMRTLRSKLLLGKNVCNSLGNNESVYEHVKDTLRFKRN